MLPPVLVGGRRPTENPVSHWKGSPSSHLVMLYQPKRRSNLMRYGIKLAHDASLFVSTLCVWQVHFPLSSKQRPPGTVRQLQCHQMPLVLLGSVSPELRDPCQGRRYVDCFHAVAPDILSNATLPLFSHSVSLAQQFDAFEVALAQ